MDMERVIMLLRDVSSEVHLTGTHANSVLRDHLVTLLQGQGHLHVTVATYTVLLSYPNWEKPNCVSLVYKNGSEAMLLNYAGPTYTNHPELAQAYVAFATNGTVQVTVVSVSLVACFVPTQVVTCDCCKCITGGVCCANTSCNV